MKGTPIFPTAVVWLFINGDGGGVVVEDTVRVTDAPAVQSMKAGGPPVTMVQTGPSPMSVTITEPP